MRKIKYFTLKDPSDVFPWFCDKPGEEGWTAGIEERCKKKTRKEIKELQKEVVQSYGGKPVVVRVVQARLKPVFFIRRKSDNFHFQPGKILGGHIWSLNPHHGWEDRSEAWKVAKELRALYPKDKIVVVKVLLWTKTISTT